MRARTLSIALLLPLLVGCPSDRRAEPTLRGSMLPPRMSDLAPQALATITKLRGPESVLYDPDQDVYFISNINGGMLWRDGNGFLSRVNAATLDVDLQWIATGLDAPKGMAILGDTLYVADIDRVRKFDRRSGAPRGEIEIAGASFLNDITTDGRSLYVSDTGIVTGPGITFYDTGSDAIWKLTGDRPEKLAGGSHSRVRRRARVISSMLAMASLKMTVRRRARARDAMTSTATA